MTKEFDLNIEKILENWEIYHAVREIIANALDEQKLTGTKDISICKDDDVWHITDYGRGLNYHHLTQNENDEKLSAEALIGKFGVGLKDSLAVFYRNGIHVTIRSCYGVITLKQMKIFVIVNHMRHDAVEREVETFAKKWYLPKEDVQYEVYNYRDGMLANENKLKDAIDYASYKDSSPNPISKLKFRKMMIEEFKDVLMPEVYPLLH